ncbi:MAG: hypothetical protein WAW52_10045 [Methanothrix sp.]
MTNVRPSRLCRVGLLHICPVKDRDPDREWPDGPVRARSESCTGPTGTARSTGGS